MEENTEFKDFRDELEVLQEMNDLKNDFKIFFDRKEKKVYLIILHFRMITVEKIIKNNSDIFCVVKNLQTNELMYLKQELEQYDVDYIKESETICISDSFNFFKTGSSILTISFPNNNDNFKLQVTKDLKQKF